MVLKRQLGHTETVPKFVVALISVPTACRFRAKNFQFHPRPAPVTHRYRAFRDCTEKREKKEGIVRESKPVQRNCLR